MFLIESTLNDHGGEYFVLLDAKRTIRARGGASSVLRLLKVALSLLPETTVQDLRRVIVSLLNWTGLIRSSTYQLVLGQRFAGLRFTGFRGACKNTFISGSSSLSEMVNTPI